MKGIGDMGLNIFCREAQLVWDELFPYVDKRTLDMAKQHGLPCKDAKELAGYCGNDRSDDVWHHTEASPSALCTPN